MARKPDRHQATRVTHAFHDTEGKLVEITIDSDKGGVTLVTVPEVMQNLASKMSELSSHAMAIKNRAEGHARVDAAIVDVCQALVPVGGAAVVVSFRGSNGIVQHFSLTPEQSESLRKEMASGEPQAIANRKKTIQ